MDTVSRFDIASFVALMNMLKYNSVDKPELYRTLLAVLCDYDPNDQQSKERTHRYVQLLVTDTVLAECLICYLPNNEDPLFLGKPRLPSKSHSKKSKHRRNEARRHREANSVRQKREEHAKPVSCSQTDSPTQSLLGAKHASPTQSIPAAKHASPTQSLPAAKQASPTQSILAAKHASPTQSLPAAKHASTTQSLPAAKHASPTRSLPAAKHASPTQSLPTAKHASPTRSLPAAKHASPTRSIPAAKHASSTQSLPAAKHASPTRSLPAAKHASPTQSLPAAKHASPTQSLPAAKHASPTQSLPAAKHQQQLQQRQQHKEEIYEERMKANSSWPGQGKHFQKRLPSSKIEKANNGQPGEGRHLLKLLSSSKTDNSSEQAGSILTDHEAKGHSSAPSVTTAVPSLPASNTSALNVPTDHIKTVFDDNPFLGGQPVLSQFPGANPSFTVPSHNQLFPSLFPAPSFPFIRQMTPGLFPSGFPTFFPVTAPQWITFQGMPNFRAVGSTVVGNMTETSFPSINPDFRVPEGKQGNKVHDVVINAHKNSTQTIITSKKNTECRTEMATPTREEMQRSSTSEKQDQDDLGDESQSPAKKVKVEEQCQTDLTQESMLEFEDSVFSVDEKYGLPRIHDRGSRGITRSLGSELDESGCKTGSGHGFGLEQRPVSVPLPTRNSGIKMKTDISNSSSSMIQTPEDMGSVVVNIIQNVEECKKDKENSKQSLVAQTLTARNVVIQEDEAKMNLDTSSQTSSYEFKQSVAHKARKTVGVKKDRNIIGNVHPPSTSVTSSGVTQGIHTSKTKTVDKNKPKGFILGQMPVQDKTTCYSMPANPTSVDFLLQKPGMRFVASKSLNNTLLLSGNQSACEKRDKNDAWSSINMGTMQPLSEMGTVQSSTSVEMQQSSSRLDAVKSLKSFTESKDLADYQCFQSQNKAIRKELNSDSDLRPNTRLASVDTFKSCQNFGSHNLSTFPYSQKITLPDGKASTMIFHGEQRDRRSVETVRKFMQNSSKSSSATLNQPISEVAQIVRTRKDLQKELLKPLPNLAAASMADHDMPTVPCKPGRVSPAVVSQMEARKKARQKVSFFSQKKKPMITTLVPNQEMFAERNTDKNLKSPTVNVLSLSREESRQLQASPNEVDTVCVNLSN